jgi:hypothetical protein
MAQARTIQEEIVIDASFCSKYSWRKVNVILANLYNFSCFRTFRENPQFLRNLSTDGMKLSPCINFVNKDTICHFKDAFDICQV